MAKNSDSDSGMTPPVLTPREIDKFADYFDTAFAELIRIMEPYPEGSGKFSVTQEFTIGGINAYSLARKRYFGEDDDDDDQDEDEKNTCIKFAKFLILITWINDPYGVMYRPKPPEKPAVTPLDDIKAGIKIEKEAEARFREEIEKLRRSGRLKADRILGKTPDEPGSDGALEEPGAEKTDADTPNAEKPKEGRVKFRHLRLPGL